MRIPLRRYLSLLVTYLKPQWFRMLLLVVFLLASIGLQLLSPQILRYFIDTALANGASLPLLWTALAFIGVALLNQVVAVASSYLSTNIAWTATNQLRSELVAHCLLLDMGFHKGRTPGEMIERIDGDVDDLSNFFSQFVVSLFTNALLMYSYTDKFSQPLQQIQSQLQDLQQAEACIRRTEELLALSSALPDGKESFPLVGVDHGAVEVAFHNVTFG